MDEKGFISIEYIFTFFIILIIAVGLLFFTSASIGSSNNIEDNVNHRLMLDNVANLISQVNSKGSGYSIYLHLDSKPEDYEITVDKNKITMEFSNRKGERLMLPIKIDSKYKLYSGKSYTVSKNDDGEIVIR